MDFEETETNAVTATTTHIDTLAAILTTRKSSCLGETLYFFQEVKEPRRSVSNRTVDTNRGSLIKLGIPILQPGAEFTSETKNTRVPSQKSKASP